MVRRYRKNDLRWSSFDTSSRFLLLNITYYSHNVGLHNSMCKFGVKIKAVQFNTTFWNCSKWNNSIQVPAQTTIHLFIMSVVKQCLNILFGIVIEGNSDQSRSLGSILRINRLVIISRVSRYEM